MGIPNHSTYCDEGDTSSLFYGSEAVLPIELIALTNRTVKFDNPDNSEDLRANLELSMERREIAAIWQ